MRLFILWLFVLLPLFACDSDVGQPDQPIEGGGLLTVDLPNSTDQFFYAGLVEGHSGRDASVPIRNSGKARLEIEKVSGSCGCISPRAEKSILEAGEKSTIFVRIQEGSVAGRATEMIHVHVKGDKVPVRIPILFDRVLDFSIHSPILDFGSVRRGQLALASTKVSGRPEMLMPLTDSEIAPGVHFGFGEIEMKGEWSSERLLRLTIDSKALGFGEHRQTYGIPGAEGHSISAKLVVVGDVTFEPPSLMFVVSSEKDTISTRKFRLVTEIANPVVSLGSNLTAVTARWIPEEQSIECSLNPALLLEDEGIVESKIAVSVRDATPSELMLPIYVVKRSRN